MFIQWFIVVVSCFIVVTGSEGDCKRWPKHKNFHLIHSNDDCGKVKINTEIRSRILNGQTVQPGSLPWMAYLTIEAGSRSFTCGGSVINERYILTAAHCVKKNKPSVKVVLGLHDKEDRFVDGLAETYHMKSYIIHPKYDDAASKNDIALIRLEKRISFKSPKVNYICLPTSCELSQKIFLGEKLTAAGWGLLFNNTVASTLQKVELPVKPCEKYKRYVPPSTNRLCTGDNDVRVCKGDSGGPLQYETSERVVQVGITSLTYKDCSWAPDELSGAYFTRVSSYIGWILDNIKP